jgi:hypothetical protein
VSNKLIKPRKKRVTVTLGPRFSAALAAYLRAYIRDQIESHGRVVQPLSYREIVEAALTTFWRRNQAKFREDKEALIAALGADHE